MSLLMFLAVVLLSSPAIAAAQESADSPATRPLWDEPAALATAADFAGRRIVGDEEGEDGFYPEMGNMITGAGWIAAGPGYRRRLFDGHAVIDTSAGISWRSYTMARARIELPRLAGDWVTVGSEIRWQDLKQVSYFGPGPGARLSDRSEYRLTSTNVAGYAVVRAREWLSAEAHAGWFGSPEIRPPTGTFRRDNPPTEVRFPQDPVFARADQPGFSYLQLALTSDTRDRAGRPTRGGIRRAGWSLFSDRKDGTFSFRRYEAEAAQFAPVAGGRLILAGRGWLLASDTGTGQIVPFYLMPGLGGNNTIRGYTDYRFRGRHMLLLNAEARLAVFEHIDGVLFADAGSVAARVRDLDLAKRSYGAGVRMHARGSTFARLDIARSPEGWQVVFRLNDPLQLGRLDRRTAPLPFAP